MANNGLIPVNKVIKELQRITEELKQHNDRMDKKCGPVNVLLPSNATTSRTRNQRKRKST